LPSFSSVEPSGPRRAHESYYNFKGKSDQIGLVVHALASGLLS
jgi:hypothetical protein